MTDKQNLPFAPRPASPELFTFGRANVRVAVADGVVWFVAKDVCNALGLRNVSMAVNGNPKTGDLGVDDEYKSMQIVQTKGGPQKLLCVAEPGVYDLVFKSSKPEARAFQDWVYGEVLPSIRKTGMYIGPWLRPIAEEDDFDSNDPISVAKWLLRETAGVRANMRGSGTRQ